MPETRPDILDQAYVLFLFFPVLCRMSDSVVMQADLPLDQTAGDGCGHECTAAEIRHGFRAENRFVILNLPTSCQSFGLAHLLRSRQPATQIEGTLDVPQVLDDSCAGSGCRLVDSSISSVSGRVAGSVSRSLHGTRSKNRRDSTGRAPCWSVA